jgi:hypothetical protein
MNLTVGNVAGAILLDVRSLRLRRYARFDLIRLQYRAEAGGPLRRVLVPTDHLSGGGNP